MASVRVLVSAYCCGVSAVTSWLQCRGHAMCTVRGPITSVRYRLLVVRTRVGSGGAGSCRLLQRCDLMGSAPLCLESDRPQDGQPSILLLWTWPWHTRGVRTLRGARDHHRYLARRLRVGMFLQVDGCSSFVPADMLRGRDAALAHRMAYAATGSGVLHSRSVLWLDSYARLDERKRRNSFRDAPCLPQPETRDGHAMAWVRTLQKLSSTSLEIRHVSRACISSTCVYH